MADNSDDKNYPPDKSQGNLDFVYSGGMYRDVFLIATQKPPKMMVLKTMHSIA